MTVHDYIKLNDHIHGTNRKELYGSDRAHFPYPHKLSSIRSTRFGTPGKMIRESKNYSTNNYENKKNLEELTKLFSTS